MGEIADMMLNGDMCQGCGEILDGDGFPSWCSSCQPEDEMPIKKATKNKIPCRYCKKMISVNGTVQHNNTKHPEIAKQLRGKK